MGIGTGWPIGAAIKRKGVVVDGCDVADNLVASAKKVLENETGIFTGDVSEWQGDTLYDVTYCVRASWCIPDFFAVVKKMIAMTKPGGYIVFDIMDKHNLYCVKNRWKDMKEQYYKFLGIDVDEGFGTHYISILKMKAFLKRCGVSQKHWKEWELTDSKDRHGSPKVVFICRKVCAWILSWRKNAGWNGQ